MEILRVVSGDLVMGHGELRQLKAFFDSMTWQKVRYVQDGCLVEKILDGSTDEFRKGWKAYEASLYRLPEPPPEEKNLEEDEAGAPAQFT